MKGIGKIVSATLCAVFVIAGGVIGTSANNGGTGTGNRPPLKKKNRPCKNRRQRRNGGLCVIFENTRKLLLLCRAPSPTI